MCAGGAEREKGWGGREAQLGRGLLTPPRGPTAGLLWVAARRPAVKAVHQENGATPCRGADRRPSSRGRAAPGRGGAPGWPCPCTPLPPARPPAAACPRSATP